MDFQLEIKDEDRKILKEFLEEFKKLNEHFQDFKELLAPKLGFRVIKDEKE